MTGPTRDYSPAPQETAERMEKALGDERQLKLFEEEVEVDEQEDPAPPDGPITVGIDGGYVRAAHKEGFFEVIAGRSVVAFRREDNNEVPERSASATCRPMTRSRGGGYGANEIAGSAGPSAGCVYVRRREDVRRVQE